jgi:porin
MVEVGAGEGLRQIVIVVFSCLAFVSPGTVAGQTSSGESGFNKGTARTPVFGGPNSPEGQLEESGREREPAFRFPAIHDAFEPWRNWKKRMSDEHGFEFTGHYTTLYQNLSDSLTHEDTASSGVFRATAKWTLLGEGTKDTGSLVAMIDHRHKFRDIAPAGLASQAGYAGVTGTLYSDIDWAVVNLNWQQGLNDGTAGLLVGRYDPNDYMNVLGYTNPWTTFSNVAVLLDASVAFPDASWGVAGGSWFRDQWFAMGGGNDANGVVSDNLEFFDSGSEFFSWGTLGWSPTQSDRYFRNVHATFWHVDQREDAGIDSAKGVALAGNWTFNDQWMPFVRAGWSEGSAPIYNRSATAGLIYKFLFRSDLVGIGLNWGDPSTETSREQKTIEAFWRVQFAQNFSITPSVQWLIDPALNPEHDLIYVAGLRMRLAF